MRFYVLAQFFAVICGLVPSFGGATHVSAADPHYRFGFSRVDISPTEPVRLSGYSDRDRAFEGIDEPLFVRAMAIKPADARPHVLVSVDTIGFPGALTREIHEAIEAKHGIPRANFVLAGTHSHTAPHIGRGLDNLYTVPQSDDERARTAAYTDRVSQAVQRAVDEALTDLKPGRLFTAEGQAHFAINRRVIADGKWTGFGINPAGPVDHALPVIKITDESGQSVRAVIFNYACHCTTFGGQYNRVNGDWAGYAAKYLEASHAGAVALCTIGCGADANPERVPERAFAIAQAQGHEIADEVDRLLSGQMQEITAPLHATYGFAGLPIDRPRPAELREKLNDPSPQIRQHAENMLAIQKRMGRLPETYPMPIQVWRFGDQYSLVFLGGEVVAEYAQRIKRELTRDGELGTPWVTAYANDVFGYVASERMRSEGGYEVDFSMIYYNQPGRWSTGTEDVVLRRVHELYDDNLPQSPLTPEASLRTFTLPLGLAIGIVASEPLITDPVHFAVGPDGRLWVVEMGDYPRGAHDDGRPGGRIQVLTDVDHDGRYDEAVTFLDGLEFPTGVMPWRAGALISGAPDILYAEDTNGDDRADLQQSLYSGFKQANPQHRVNGFAYGLDHWLYLAGGDSSGEITAVRTGERVNVSRRDSRIDPDRHLIAAETGSSQFGRTRDDWGSWFGNENSQPLYHYVIPDRYFARNPYVPAGKPLVRLFDQPAPPAVYPTSRTVDRFNDLFTENRFTSACSPHIFRDLSLGDDVYGAALICEPVHNLVSRTMLEPDGQTFRWSRHANEQKSEFLSSTDNWFRPTQLATGPDGALWVADMYRLVIEHPEWIPEAWQAQINLYAGNDRGRIYRVYRRSNDQPPRFEIPDLTRLSDEKLAAMLQHANGWRRDTAQILLMQRESLSPAAVSLLEWEARDDSQPAGQVHSLNVLHARSLLKPESLLAALSASHPLVVREAVRIGESQLEDEPIRSRVIELARHADPRVRLQVALTLGETEDPRAAGALADIAAGAGNDVWLQAAVASSANGHALALLSALLERGRNGETTSALIPPLVSTALGDDPVAGLERLLNVIAPSGRTTVDDWQLTSTAAAVDALERRSLDLVHLGKSESSAAIQSRLSPIFTAARAAATDESAALSRRLAAAGLLGRGPEQAEYDRALLASWLAPQSDPELQSAAIAALARLRTDDVPQRLLDQWSSAAPQLRARILDTLLTRPAWTEQLVAALEAGTLTAADLDATARARLGDDPQDSLRRRAIAVLGAPTSNDRAQVISTFHSVFDLAGDPQRGAAVFKQRCAACHQHQGIGTNVGAQLSALTNKSTDFLVTAILDPNRAVEFKFMAYNVLMNDGRVLSGLIVDESAASLTIAKADGSRDTVLRSEVERLSSTRRSFMPDGLEKDLNVQDLADVISFVQLTSPTSPRIHAP